MAKKWYIVHTYSGYENRVTTNIYKKAKSLGLQDKIGEILIPTEPESSIEKVSKKGTKRKYFPGYIIVEMEFCEETWHLIKNTPNVTGFVGDANKPLPVPLKEIEKIKKQMVEGTAKPAQDTSFEEGMTVRIKDGPFVNFSGLIEEVKTDKKKLKVLVSIFGRATPVEVDFHQVERT